MAEMYGMLQPGSEFNYELVECIFVEGKMVEVTNLKYFGSYSANPEYKKEYQNLKELFALPEIQDLCKVFREKEAKKNTEEKRKKDEEKEKTEKDLRKKQFEELKKEFED